MFVCLVLLLCDLPQTALLNLSLDGGLCLSIFYLPLLSFLLFICCYCSLLSRYPVVKVNNLVTRSKGDSSTPLIQWHLGLFVGLPILDWSSFVPPVPFIWICKFFWSPPVNFLAKVVLWVLSAPKKRPGHLSKSFVITWLLIVIAHLQLSQRKSREAIDPYLHFARGKALFEKLS